MRRCRTAVFYLQDGGGDYEIEGSNNGQAMVIGARHDRATPVCRHILGHETVHYWFGGTYSVWINECLSEFLV